MKEKNPWIAAILNFFLPGIGFAYLGTPILILGGAFFFIFDFVATSIIWMIFFKYGVRFSGQFLVYVFAVLSALSLAVIAYAVTEIHNRKIPA
jgi:hypothetical protein